jgi:SAM-dependent methyltransferase
MRDDVYEEMFRIEDAHWWYVSKRRIVSSLIARYAGSNGQAGTLKVADLGCGCGAMLSRLREAGHECVGVDPSPLAIEFSARRGLAVLKGSFPDQIPLDRDAYDVALMLDVIEHLQDDVAGLRASSAILRPGGRLIITVPAYQWLWSDWDTLHHHFRRYNRSTLRGSLEAAGGLEIELLSYANTALFPLAALARMLHRLRGGKIESADMKVPPAPVNALFRGIYSAERHALGRVPMPFGLSVVAVARKQG